MNPLRHSVFRMLFAAQLLSLLGIGLMTVGLALRAYELEGAAGAGRLLGTVFALKMLVYVFLAPPAEALLSRCEPRRVLVGLDIARLALLLLLGLVFQVWQLLLITCVLYMASAGFTPLFQSLIPAIFKDDEETYASALVLSRLAYTFESLVSPILAAVALQFLDSARLFPLAAICLGGSVVALLCSKVRSAAVVQHKRPFLERLTRGLKIYFLTPRLRGLFALNLALSIAMAWVLVNSVVYAGSHLQDSDFYTWLMGAYGAGSAAAALSVPYLLNRCNERRLMIAGCTLFGLLSWLILLDLPRYPLMLLWAAFGMASSLVLTPGGLVLTRSAALPDRPAVFAAQFSMSHAGWLLAYPLAGWLGATLSPDIALVLLGSLCLLITAVGRMLWPVDDPLEREHRHPDLPVDHPHLQNHLPRGSQREHSHVFHIDDLHLRWNP